MAKFKKKAPLHVVRQWTSSQVIYGYDSRERQPNPDYHPTIGLTSTGKFVDEAGRELDPKTIPARILAAAKTTNLDTEYRPPKRQEVNLDRAMLDAGVPETDPDPAVRASRARRGRRAA